MTLVVAYLGLLVSVFVISVDAGPSMHNEFYCYSSDPIRPQTRMHGTRSSYEAIRRTSFDPHVSSCTPSRFWFLCRHGGQFPAATLLQQMIDLAESSIQADIESNYNAGRTTLCREDFEAIRNWTIIDPNFVIENAGLVTETSTIAMQNIARRYQQLYPSILPENYSPTHYHFRHTRFAPSNNTIRAFVDGLFGESESGNVHFEDIPDRDSFLSPTQFCPAFTQEVANQHQLAAFRRGPEIEEVVRQVNRKLGFQGSDQLSLDRILIMWEWCRRDTGDRFDLSDSEIGENVPWCAPFSIANNMLLEYDTDLSYYYVSGYGVRNRRLIQNLNCGLVQDLLAHMQSNDDTDSAVRVFSSNSHVLLLLMVTFGALEDTWILHQHNFAQQTARQYLTSLITPRSGNLAVVRYDCADGDHDLLFLLNESPLLIPGCGTQNGICKLSFIVNRLQRFVGANCEEVFCSSE